MSDDSESKRLADLARKLLDDLPDLDYRDTRPSEMGVVVLVVEYATGHVGWATNMRSRARMGLALKAAARSVMD